MKSILKTILVIFCSLFLMQAVTIAQDKSTDNADKAAKTSRTDTTGADKESKIEFPDVEGWKKSVVRNPTTELGDMIHYDSNEGRVTVYFYNGGLKNISDDIKNGTLKDEMENAKNGIRQLGEMGIYQNVREVKSDTITLGGASGKVKALHSLFNFSAKGRELVSEIYLFGYKNNFVKIRATRPKEGGTENKALAGLLAELDTHFSK
jgi:hypothetical protein